MNHVRNTESRILHAAEELFLRKGFAGTSTTEIAKAADCNQALVYYYFRTKEKLFSHIFERKLSSVLDAFAKPLREEDDIFALIRRLTSCYFDFLTAQDGIAYTVVHEILSDEKRLPVISRMFRDKISEREEFALFGRSVRKAHSNGLIRDVDALTLMVDILSLCLSSALLAPVMRSLTDGDDNFNAAFFEARKEEILKLIIVGIKA